MSIRLGRVLASSPSLLLPSTSICSKNFSAKFGHNAIEVKPKELSLRREIVQRIKSYGPISLAEYMNLILINPLSGFYSNHNIYGSKALCNSVASISQLFSELISIWLLNEWQRFGCPKPFRVVELGPGRGTLSMNIARTMSQYKHSKDVTSLHLIEFSPHLTQIQEQNICGTISLIEKQNNARNGIHSSLTKCGVPITWYRSLDQLPSESGFTAFIAHEFFNALPIHKFVRLENGQWSEVLVDVNYKNDLCYTISNGATFASKVLIDTIETSHHLEVCPQAAIIANDVVSRINQKNPGCFLICDYGYDDLNVNESKDTFRAFRDLRLWDPLKEPGTAELTADVNFSYLKRSLQSKGIVFGSVPQAHFLKNLGVELKLYQMMKNIPTDERKALESGVEMMLSSMGQRYKFLSIFPSSSQNMFGENPPTGFA